MGAEVGVLGPGRRRWRARSGAVRRYGLPLRTCPERPLPADSSLPRQIAGPADGVAGPGEPMIDQDEVAGALGDAADRAQVPGVRGRRPALVGPRPSTSPCP